MKNTYSVVLEVMSPGSSVVRAKREFEMKVEPIAGKIIYLDLDFLDPLNGSIARTTRTCVILTEVIIDIEEDIFEVRGEVYA